MNIDKDDRAPKMDAINIPTAPEWATRGRTRLNAIRSVFTNQLDIASIMVFVTVIGVIGGMVTAAVSAITGHH